MPGRMPDFLIIGAPRCGTSQFYAILTRHPQVQRAAKKGLHSRKELHYFDRPSAYKKGPSWYSSRFPSAQDGSITGEATPRYLAHPLVPERVARQVPEVRLIALLRDPVERAYSHYHFLKRSSGLQESFEEAVDREEAWLAEHTLEDLAPTNLLTTGLYVEHLKRWRAHFPIEQLLVLHSADFFRRMRETLDATQEFLGLPARRIDLKFEKSWPRYEPMRPETEARLRAFFTPYNERLYEYLGCDFGWL